MNGRYDKMKVSIKVILNKQFSKFLSKSEEKSENFCRKRNFE